MAENDDIKVSRREFQELREEVTEMRTAVLGIGGQDGFRGDLAELKSDVKELTRNVNDIISSLNVFKDTQLNNHKLFATKAEVSNLEHAVILKLNDFDRKRDEARKADKMEAEEKDRLNRNDKLKALEFGLKKNDIAMAKLAIGLSILGMLVTSAFTIIKFFV